MSKKCPIYGRAIYLDCLECTTKECVGGKKKYSQVCIGVDQSYANTGISISADGRLIKVRSEHLDRYKTNSDKRRGLGETLRLVLDSCTKNSDMTVCILERIRLQSKGFVNIDYIKSIGALNSVIVDACNEYLVNTYSVDTRCWKSQVIGTSKPKGNKFGVPDEKWPTVEWLIKQDRESDILIDATDTRKTSGVFWRDGKKYMYNNDAADSAGISMFWFVGDRSKLKEEK